MWLSRKFGGFLRCLICPHLRLRRSSLRIRLVNEAGVEWRRDTSCRGSDIRLDHKQRRRRNRCLSGRGRRGRAHRLTLSITVTLFQIWVRVVGFCPERFQVVLLTAHPVANTHRTLRRAYRASVTNLDASDAHNRSVPAKSEFHMSEILSCSAVNTFLRPGLRHRCRTSSKGFLVRNTRTVMSSKSYREAASVS